MKLFIAKDILNIVIGRRPDLKDTDKFLWLFVIPEFLPLTLSSPVFLVVHKALRGGGQRPRCQKSRLTSAD